MQVDSEIWGFNGLPRQGKTMGVSILGNYYRNRGAQIFCNFNFEGGTFITPLDLVYFLKQGAEYQGYKPLFNAVLLGQEFQTWVESRLGKARAELLITDFICQAPKLGIKLIYDAQLNSSVDKRLKQNCSKRWEAERYPNDDNKWRFIRYWELNIENTEENERTGKKRSVPRAWIERHVLRLGTGLEPIYNTRKVSLRPDFNETVTALEKQDPRIMLATIDRQRDLLMQNRTLWLKPSKAHVEVALLRLKEPTAFSSHVAAALELALHNTRP